MYRKIENVLPVLYETCMTNGFKEKWQWPERDPKTGLFKDKYFKKKKRDSKMDVTEGDSLQKEQGIFEMA